MEIKNVCVIGAGVMGSGIAQLASTYGYQVNLVDINENILEKAKSSIEKNLNRFFVAKGKISDSEAKEILNRIRLITDREDAIKDVQIVVEAVFEDMDLKQQLFSLLW